MPEIKSGNLLQTKPWFTTERYLIIRYHNFQNINN